MAGVRSLILALHTSLIRTDSGNCRKRNLGEDPPDVGVSVLERGPAAGAEVKVRLSALGTFLGVDCVLFVAGTADDIGDSQGAVCTYDGFCHFNSSEDRIADQN